YGALVVVTVATFAVCFLCVGREKLTPGDLDRLDVCRAYWSDSFPPGNPLELATWLASIHSGRMMAYPIGDAHGGSAVTLILFLIGIRCWQCGPQRDLLLLALAPFALNMAAAVLRQYPYGGCCRLSQHLAPAVCLLAGSGGAWCVERWTRTLLARQRAICLAGGALCFFGIGTLAVDLRVPYRDLDAVWNDRIAKELLRHVRPQDQIAVLLPRDRAWILMQWHLGMLKDRVVWGDKLD